MKTFHIDEPIEIGKKRIRVSKKDLTAVKDDLQERVLRKKIREEILNEMDYKKLVPIQVDNVMISLNKIGRANAFGKVKAVKRFYMDAFKNFKTLKKSIDKLI
jgi:hypothetical protein